MTDQGMDQRLAALQHRRATITNAIGTWHRNQVDGRRRRRRGDPGP